MEEIRERTGWFRGKDGQWRFEISDKDATLKPNWDDKVALATTSLAEVLDHPKLFENYPALAKIGVRLKDLPAGTSGFYDSRDRIVLNTTLDDREIRSVLLHEIQHVVQTIERFARGGSTRSASVQKAALERYNEEYDALEKRLHAIRDRREDWIREHESEYPSGRAQVDAAHDAKFPQVARELGRMRERIGELGYTTRFKAYERLLGEVEARDVQARKDMTDEERRGSAPYVSQGIREEDFIIDFTGEAAALQQGLPGDTPSTSPFVRGRAQQKPGPAGLSASGVRAALSGRFGAGVGRLVEAGTLRIAQHESELHAHLNDRKGGIRGVYDPTTETVWMVADNLTAADAPGVFLHELGVHFGLEAMVGGEKYQDIIRQMKAMEGLGNEALRAARAAIPTGTPKAAVDDELLAYLVEKHPELPIVKRIIAAIRAFLFRHGLIKNVKPEDVVALAKAAAKHAGRTPSYLPLGKGEEPNATLFSRVQVGGDAFGPYSGLEDLRRKVRDYAQREYVLRPKVEIVRASKEQVIIPWQGVKHTIASARDEATLKTVKVLPELISTSRHTKTEPDRQGRRNIKAVHEYQADAAIDGQSYRVLIVVREHLDGKRFYDHVAIAEQDEPAGISGERQSASSDGSLQPAAGSESTIGGETGDGKAPLYSRGTPPDPNTPEGAAAALGRIGEAMRATRHGWEAVKSKLIEDWRPARLAFATRRQLVDIGQGMVPELADYDRAVQAMDADRNQLDGETHEVAEIAEAYVQANPKEADDFFDLLHAATLAGTDPAETFRPSINKGEAFREMASLRRRMRTRPGEANVLQGQIDEIQVRLDNEKVRKGAHPGLTRRYAGLSQDAKVVYARMRDLYMKRFDERETALIERIRDTEADERWKARLIADIKHRFETARLSAPYFPLTRFGDFWVAAVNPDGEREFHLRESAHQMKALTEDLARAGYHDIASGRKIDTLFEQQGASAEFVTEVIKLLDRGTHISHAARADLKDAIYQMYLQSLPELSTRRHWIHRKKTPGFSKDAVRGFAKHMFHGNRQLAVLRQQTPMEKALADARKREKFGSDPAHEPMEQALRDMRKAKKKGDPELVALEKALNAARKSVKDGLDPVRTADLINEMQKRDQWIKNPQVSSFAYRAGSLGFLWYLTAPASAIVNVTQTPLVAYPLMAARHGWVKSAAALNRAAVDFFKGRFSVEGALQGEELAAYRRFLADAVIDKTQTHDLAGMAETPSGSYSGRGAKAMRAASWMFHRAEVMNREITALAAYRLARADGLGIEAAYQQAKTLTFEAHFDYSTGNKPRFLQNDAARVFLMFKQFSQHMIYLLGRSAHQSVKGLTPVARSEARTRLTGLLGMHALFAGALGMPLMSTLAFVMNALFDDEDEPWDFETEFRNFLAEAFGPEIGQAIARGPVESLTGLGIASRVGLSDSLVPRAGQVARRPGTGRMVERAAPRPARRHRAQGGDCLRHVPGGRDEARARVDDADRHPERLAVAALRAKGRGKPARRSDHGGRVRMEPLHAGRGVLAGRARPEVRRQPCAEGPRAAHPRSARAPDRSLVARATPRGHRGRAGGDGRDRALQRIF